MPPLFAFKPTPGYQWTMTVGPVVLSWGEWLDLLYALAIAFALVSLLVTCWRGRWWWMLIPITLLAWWIDGIWRSYGKGQPFHESFNAAVFPFFLQLPLVIVHAVLSFTLPRRGRLLSSS
jgi:hypothetical protein